MVNKNFLTQPSSNTSNTRLVVHYAEPIHLLIPIPFERIWDCFFIQFYNNLTLLGSPLVPMLSDCKTVLVLSDNTLQGCLPHPLPRDGRKDGLFCHQSSANPPLQALQPRTGPDQRGDQAWGPRDRRLGAGRSSERGGWVGRKWRRDFVRWV